MEPDGLTVVSAFFNLKKFEPDNSYRPGINHYLKFGEFLTQKNINLVIFTDIELVDTITLMRTDLVNKTKVIGLDLKSLDYFKYLPLYDQYRKLNPVTLF